MPPSGGIFFTPTPMKIGTSLKIALAFLVASIVIKLALKTFGVDVTTAVYGYILFIVAAAAVGIFALRRQANEALSYTMELKAGMQPLALYSLLVSGFTYIYYSFIHPGYFETLLATQINKRIQEGIEKGYTEAEIQTVIQSLESSSATIHTPFIWSTITFFSLLFLGFIYTLFLTLVLRVGPAKELKL